MLLVLGVVWGRGGVGLRRGGGWCVVCSLCKFCVFKMGTKLILGGE
jgi:hypothetical protein